jgi:methylitaconate Delta-isomerase
MKEFRKIPCVIQRGGTSKGVFLHARDLPKDQALRDKVILSIFGSPDRRQIDGLGGADPLTSKVAIIAPSTRPDCDIDYTFGAVDLTEPLIDYRGNCGNISSGVGPFAVDEGLVKVTGDLTVVRIFNTNTKKTLKAWVPTPGGKVQYTGNFAISGVPGTAAKLLLDYAGTAGSATGKILPTGRPVDCVSVPSLGTVEVSIVDAANPVCFIKPQALGLVGTEGPRDERVTSLLDTIELIRGMAAKMIGLVDDERKARMECPSIPLLSIVSPSADYVSFSDGRRIKAEDMDFVARVFYMQEMHKAHSVTAAVCTATAALVPGTLVNQVANPAVHTTKVVRIGHPSGVIPIETEVAGLAGGEVELKKAALGRTSRRIMDGFVYVPESLFSK